MKLNKLANYYKIAVLYPGDMPDYEEHAEVYSELKDAEEAAKHAKRIHPDCDIVIVWIRSFTI